MRAAAARPRALADEARGRSRAPQRRCLDRASASPPDRAEPALARHGARGGSAARPAGTGARDESRSTSLRQRSTAPWAARHHARERARHSRRRAHEPDRPRPRDHARVRGAGVRASRSGSDPGGPPPTPRSTCTSTRFASSPRWPSVWTPTTDLGEVHSAQYSGYLWPMGPFFAALHAIGLGAWVVRADLAGTDVRVLGVGDAEAAGRAASARPRGAVHVVAAALLPAATPT